VIALFPIYRQQFFGFRKFSFGDKPKKIFIKTVKNKDQAENKLARETVLFSDEVKDFYKTGLNAPSYNQNLIAGII